MKFLLSSSDGRSAQHWGVFSTRQAAQAFAVESEKDDADGDEGVSPEDFEMPWTELRDWKGEPCWQTVFDMSYSGATWTVTQVHEDPAYAEMAEIVIF